MATHLQIAAVTVAERVAFKTAYKFLSNQMGSYIDDIFQEAYFVAMECCEKYVDHAKHNPKVFEKLVARATKFRLVDFAISIQPVHIPLRSYNRGLHKILGFDPKGVQMTTLEGNDRPVSWTFTEEAAEEVMSRLFSDLSDEDETIARMRHTGHGVVEIGEAIGKSKSYVAKRIKTIQGSIL
jgi:hypothetical protein